MFDKIITSNEIKFNDLEKKVFKFVCFFGCLIIKLLLELYDKKLMNARDTKQYNKIPQAIEGLKYELGGEYNALKKLKTLQSYLSNDLARYQDVLDVPEEPEGVEYRNMGTQESQIFSKLKKRFCSGRKAFGKHGANALAKVCVLSEKFKIDELEQPIPIDTSVEDWINGIESQVKATKKYHCAKENNKENIGTGVITGHTELKFMKELEKVITFSQMKCIF